MSRSPRMILLLVVGVLSALQISPHLASAQIADRDATWAVLDVVATINGAIDENKGDTALREKAVRRLAECSLIYGGLSTQTSNAESKKNYVEAQVATSEVEATIAKPLQKEKRLELEKAAYESSAIKLRALKAQGDKEIGPLLKNCKALNDVREIKNALRELPPQ
jgi:hypothetical protein